ncbi:hypothetical protein [Kosmotoga pacifica]|uniref:Lipoprotein n=1 Tax=Kosmotoga pacifica TaxID=1330330 RepID=A0A0G2Z4R8_9BACT|nr:hypothetical protein [Kosmotoga pacifica]AKI96547.1 hypothetical protein IX53_00465 [Kosmotoga pacifica]
MKKLLIPLVFLVLLLVACGPTEWDLNKEGLKDPTQANVSLVAQLPGESDFGSLILPGENGGEGSGTYAAYFIITQEGETTPLKTVGPISYTAGSGADISLATNISLVRGFKYDFYSIFYNANGIPEFLGYETGHTVPDTGTDVATITLAITDFASPTLSVTAVASSDFYQNNIADPFSGANTNWGLFNVAVSIDSTGTIDLSKFLNSANITVYQNIDSWVASYEDEPYRGALLTSGTLSFVDKDTNYITPSYQTSGSIMNASGYIAVPLNADLAPESHNYTFYYAVSGDLFPLSFYKSMDVTSNIQNAFATFNGGAE